MRWQHRLETRAQSNVSQAVRSAWLVFTALAVGLAVPGIPRYYRLLLAPCDGISCFAAQVTGEAARVAVGAGDLRGYALVQTMIALLIAIPPAGTAAVLIWRKVQQPTAVLAAFVGIALATGTFGQALAHTDPRFRFPAQLILFVQVAGLPPLLCLLPDGHFRPRGVRWVALGYVLTSLLYLAPSARDWLTPGTTGHAFWLAYLALVARYVLAILICRLRRATDTAQQAQLRWMLAGMGLAVPVALTGTSLGLLRSISTLMALLASSGLWQFISMLLAVGSFACLLVALTNPAQGAWTIARPSTGHPAPP